MSKAKFLALATSIIFVSLMIMPAALADIAPPPDCKPGEDPETTYCEPVKIPRTNPTPVVEPIIEPVVEPLVKPPIEPVVEPIVEPIAEPETESKDESGINPTIIYIAGGTAVIVTGIAIGIVIKIRSKKIV